MTVIEVVVMSYRSFPSIGQISDKHTLSATRPDGTAHGGPDRAAGAPGGERRLTHLRVY